MSQDISTDLDRLIERLEHMHIKGSIDDELMAALLELKRRRETEASGICQLNAGTIAHIERLAGMPYDEWVDWCHSIKPSAAPKES